MDGYDKDKIIICPNCGKPEYWGEMRMVDGMSYCRGCYIALLAKNNVRIDTGLGGPARPTFDDLRAQGGGTGKFDKFGDEIMEGDIVHFRTSGLSGKGVVFFQEKPDCLGTDPFRIIDTRPGKQKGRKYPYYKDATYRIDGHREEGAE